MYKLIKNCNQAIRTSKSLELSDIFCWNMFIHSKRIYAGIVKARDSTSQNDYVFYDRNY